jgi:hypothetical protein
MIARRVLLLFVAVLGTAHAQSDTAAGTRVRIELSPVLLDFRRGPGSTLGLEYAARGNLGKISLSGNDAGKDAINPDASVGALRVGYDFRGTIATAKERNPKNHLEHRVDLALQYSLTALSFDVGGFARVESDQSFEDRNFAAGARGTLGTCAIRGGLVCIVADGAYGRINPSKDRGRIALVGSNPGAYTRLDGEALIQIGLHTSQIRGLELNYRVYHELDAPQVVRDARLATHTLGTVHLSLAGGLFVACSEGKLPFDRRNDRITEAGWTLHFR